MTGINSASFGVIACVLQFAAATDAIFAVISPAYIPVKRRLSLFIPFCLPLERLPSLSEVVALQTLLLACFTRSKFLIAFLVERNGAFVVVADFLERTSRGVFGRADWAGFRLRRLDAFSHYHLPAPERW